jgi:hypothetical protein
MTLAEREYFRAGFVYAFTLAVGVQRQVFDRLDSQLDALEHGVARLESRPWRVRIVRRLEPAGHGWDGRQLYRVTR